jgi:tRNA wybutosine-synthesizing protein 3
MFDEQKKSCLARPDLSKKGSIDPAIAPLVTLLNKSPDYYTTSSCAGRIVLLKEPASGKKKDCVWLYSTHDRIVVNDIFSALSNPPQELVWLRMESFIVHVCARDLASADRLLKAARVSGLKHSGIISLGRKITVEIIGHDDMVVPVSRERMLVSPDYLTELVQIANTRFLRTRSMLARFTAIFRSE